MKRDLDLIREILLYFESKEDVEVVQDVEEMGIDGYDALSLKHHLVLMYDAGLLNAEAIRSRTDPGRTVDVLPFFLTWEGHEFLDSIRDETRFNTIKRGLVLETGGWTLDLVKSFGSALIRQQLGI